MESAKSTFQELLRDFHHVIALTLNLEGQTLHANTAYLETIAALGLSAGVENFITPDFPSLLNATPKAGNIVYKGKIVIGSPGAGERTYTGAIVRHDNQFYVVGEIELLAFDRLNQQLTHMSAEIAELQEKLERRDRALRSSFDRIAELKRHDDLTGLYTRRELDEMISVESARSERYAEDCSLILADVDHFARVNDALGFVEADLVLRELGLFFDERKRATDIAARFDGQTFALLLPQTGDMGALLSAGRLRNEISAQRFEPYTQPLTASFGVAVIIREEPVEALYDRAWKALRFAKDQGRNCVALASADGTTPQLFEQGAAG